MSSNTRFSLASACALLATSGMTACIKKTSPSETSLNLAVQFPTFSANLAGDSWLAPFQLNILIEGANGFVHREAVTASKELSLVVPQGPLRVRANYFGIELPLTATGDMICNEGGSQSLNLGGGGDGPMALYIAESDQSLNVSSTTSEVTVAFANLQLANELEFAATLKYGDGTPAANAQIGYRDILTGLPIEGPCGAADAPKDTANASGLLRAKYFIGSQDAVLPSVITHNGSTFPISFPLSATQPVKNFFNVNLTTNAVEVAAATADFDGDGLSNATDPDPFCGPSYCDYTYGGTGGGTSGGTDGTGGSGGGSGFYAYEGTPYSGTNASVNANISFYFSQIPNTTTLAGKVKIFNNSTNAEVPYGSFYFSENRVLFKPTSLAPNSSYRVEVGSGITSTSGATLSEPLIWTFATGPSVSFPLDVNYIWPNTKEEMPISASLSFGVKFNQPLDISQNFSNLITLTDIANGTTVAKNCSNYREWGSEAEINCYPTSPLTAGKRYRIEVLSSLKASAGNTLGHAVKSEFTVFNSSIAQAAPLALRKFPLGDTVRQDAVSGVFFDKPVQLDTWNLISSGKFTIRDSSNALVTVGECEQISELNGFICMRNDPLAVGTYTATLSAGSVYDSLGQTNTAATWAFTVVATDTTQFARIFEHPVTGTVADLTKITTLTIYNKPIRTTSSYGSNLTVYATPMPYPTSTPTTNESYNGTMMHKEGGPVAYMATTRSLYTAGDFTFTHNGIYDSTEPIPTASPTPGATPQAWSVTLAAPTLMITNTIPMQGEVVSKYSPIIVAFNKPIVATDATIKDYIKINGVLLSSSADYSVMTEGYTATSKLKISRITTSYTQGISVNVEFLTGAGSPFAEMGGGTSRFLTFSIATSEPTPFVSRYYPQSELVGYRSTSTSTTVSVTFNQNVDTATIILDACPVNVSTNTCGTTLSTGGGYSDPTSFSPEKTMKWNVSGISDETHYRFTVSGAKTLDGNIIPAFSWDLKRVYGFTAGTLTYPAGNWAIANQSVSISPLVFTGGADYGINCQWGAGGWPYGLTLDSNTCTITGVPTYPTAQATYYIHWHDEGGCREDPVTIGVAGFSNASSAPMFTTSAPQNWALGLIAPSSGSTCTITPALPGGLTLNPATCDISGTAATATSPTNYTVNYVDALLGPITNSFWLEVAP